MLRQSRKRARNRFSVRKAAMNNKEMTNVTSTSPGDTTTDGLDPIAPIQHDSSALPAVGDESSNSTPTMSDDPMIVVVDKEGSECTSLCAASGSHISQSASTSPKRFRSSSSFHRSVSPARFYRQKEQSELQNLNDRLSSHVETVKQLQSENAGLRLQLEGLDILRAEKDSTTRHFHQTDIETLHSLLDRSRQDSNNLEQVLQVTRKERDSLRQTLGEKEEDLALLEIRVQTIKSASAQCAKMETEIKSLKETLKEREADAKRLSDDLVKEKMTRKRLEEEAQMNKSRYIKEMEEANVRMNRHLESTDQKLEAGYEVLVNEALVGVREQNARDLAALKQELTTIYQEWRKGEIIETKLSDWKSKAERSNADLISSRKELKASRSEVEALRVQATRLKMDAAAYKVQIEEDQTKLTEVKNESEREACQLQREMIILKQELSEVKDELEEMGGANMRLEREIATYRVLLDDLDSKSPFTTTKTKDGRLMDGKLSLGPDHSDGLGSDCCGGNNQDIYLRTNEMHKGVGIDIVDADGRYLSVVNRADHLVDLCLWTVQQSSNSRRVKIEIPYSTPVTSDQRLYIWADGEGPFKDRPGCDQIMSLPDDLDTRHFYRIHTNNSYYNNNKRNNSFDGGSNCSSTNTTITDANNNDSKPELTDAMHISMRDKRWLRRPTSMNIRLEDGDSQLQAKCDFTTISKLKGFGLESAVVADSPVARDGNNKQIIGKPTPSLYGGVGVPGAVGQEADMAAVNGLRHHVAHAQTMKKNYEASGGPTTRVLSGIQCDKELQALSKDGCVLM